MKSYFKFIFVALAAALAVLTTSCEDFVEIDVPDSQLTGTAVFSDTGTADAALLNVYARLRNNTLLTGNSGGLGILLGAASDELTVYSASGLAEEFFYQNNLNSESASVTTLWGNAYNTIYAANAVMEGVSASGSIPMQDKDRIYGEALALRTLVHFYLMELYGAIPYATTSSYLTNVSIGKTSPAALYTLLANDLVQAIDRLPEAYTGPRRTRINKAVARALLAKVQLYMGDYPAAAASASEIIGNSQYTLVNDLTAVFLADSPGTIWQLSPTMSGENTFEAQAYIFVSGPPPNRALSPSLISAFEPGDLRFTNWVGSVSAGSDTWYYPYKYKQPAFTASSLEYSIVMRLEELYLIRAEAYANTGNLPAAILDLNTVRSRAGLDDLTPPDLQSLLEAIVRERRVELFSEHGNRWFDLKRLGLSHAVLGPEKPGWNSTDSLLPLPENELLLNPNLLPQNPGF